MKSIEPSDLVEIIDWHKDQPIALFKEAADPTIESIQESWQLLRNLTEGKQFHLIADLSKVSPPLLTLGPRSNDSTQKYNRIFCQNKRLSGRMVC